MGFVVGLVEVLVKDFFEDFTGVALIAPRDLVERVTLVIVFVVDFGVIFLVGGFLVIFVILNNLIV